LTKRARFVDDLIARLIGDHDKDPSVCVMAVGGYGRSWLFPGSDVDLLFVHPSGRAAEAEALATRVLYPLWDAGLRVSHAVRTPKDCVAEAERDLKSLTTALGARLLAGPAALFEEAHLGVVGVVRRNPLAFVDDLRRSREERRERFGVLHHQREPDLKEALGGIRDVHMARWLTEGLGREERGGPGLEPADVSALSRDTPALPAARAALHVLTTGSSDRLVADVQPAVAKAMGIGEVPGWTAEEQLMRTVLREARSVDVRVESVLESLAARKGSDRVRRRGAAQPSISLPGFLRSFADMAEAGVVASPSEIGSVRRDLRQSIRWSSEVVDDFLRVLSAGEHGVRLLETMDAMGQLARLLPEWDQVAGRPQRDPYHRFPVDVHLMATAAQAARLLREADEPFAVEAVKSVDDPAAVLLGALLHDIGKVGTGSHVPAGVRLAGKVLDRMGVTGDRKDHVLFLVGEHLLLSETATRRNLEDEDLILHVAARIGDERRLAMLYLLTVADATATGPSASTPWRMALVRDLVAKVSHVFARGSMDRVRAGRLTAIEASVRRELSDLPAQDVEAFLEAVPTSYLQSIEPADASEHLPLVLPAPRENEIRTSVRRGRSAGTKLVAVAARDRLGLLASVAGAMTLSGLSILSAQVFTTEHGVALDLFEVRGAFEPEIPGERWRRFERSLGESVRGQLDLGTEVTRLRSHYRPPAADVAVSVALHQVASDFFTVVEVEGPDRLGLLFDLTSALARHRFDVHSAKVATYGPRVVDVFYVTEADGQKVGARETELERALQEAASAG
jgi:[protein-PII] uridylyltransferase